MIADLKNAAGEKVVSIEVARRAAAERVAADNCPHLSILVDPLLVHVTCKKCGAWINATEWIALVAEHWECIEVLHEKLLAQGAALDLFDNQPEIGHGLTNPKS